MKLAARTILFGQLVFYLGLAVCVLLRPMGLAANNGISYYGIYRLTVVPYALGLLPSAYLLLRASEQLPATEKILRLSFRIYAPLLVGIVITPYAAGRWMDYLHTACGSALFSLQLILSGYLVWRLHYSWWAVTLALLELAAGIASAIYLSPSHGFLFQTQVLFQIAFGALLILSLLKLTLAARIGT